MNNKETPIPINPSYLSNSTPLETYSGEAIWQTGHILRRVKKTLNGTTEEFVVPIQVFFDPRTGQILDNLLPSEIREEYSNRSVIPPTTSIENNQPLRWQENSNPNQSENKWEPLPNNDEGWNQQPQADPSTLQWGN